MRPRRRAASRPFRLPPWSAGIVSPPCCAPGLRLLPRPMRPRDATVSRCTPWRRSDLRQLRRADARRGWWRAEARHRPRATRDRFRGKLRAIARRCFCLPGSVPPRQPVAPSSRAGGPRIGPSSRTSRATSRTSSSEVPRRPRGMFPDRAGEWGPVPPDNAARRAQGRGRRIAAVGAGDGEAPAPTSWQRRSSAQGVVVPRTDGPTSAIGPADATARSRSRSAGRARRQGARSRRAPRLGAAGRGKGMDGRRCPARRRRAGGRGATRRCPSDGSRSPP